MESFHSFPNLYSWLETLPPISQWKPLSTKLSLNLCPSSSSSQHSLKLSIKNLKGASISLSIYVDYNLPVVLWTSKTLTLTLNPAPNRLTDDTQTVTSLFINFVEDVLKYGPNTCPYSLKLLPPLKDNVQDVFNFCFLSLSFVICIYEAPNDVRCLCLRTLKDQFSGPGARSASRALMRVLGLSIEGMWMRSINLAIANLISELQYAHVLVKTPSPLFSHSLSNFGFWKVQLYCPIIAMAMERSSSPIPDDRLAFSLNYHQLEGVIQLNYKVVVHEKWVEVMVNIDNIRCNVVKLLSDNLLTQRGAGTSEKHFPSRIALQITPTLESSIIALSVGKSSNNPSKEITHEKGFEASFEPPTTVGLNFSTGEASTKTIKPWKFEQSVFGNSANLNWYLHDSIDGREVFSSKPSRLALVKYKAWFKNRYSNADRVFTREGGVVFAGDEYGDGVWWRVDKGCLGKRMEWQVKGWIWVTYWPNEYWSSYSETRRLEFKELLSLTLG